MHAGSRKISSRRIFGLGEWDAWLDRSARATLGMTGAEFEEAHAAGRLPKSGIANDLKEVLSLIIRIRQRSAT